MSAAPFAAGRLADRLTDAADQVTTVERAIGGLMTAAGTFAADEAGVPGRIGLELHRLWAAALTARAREAAETAARLTDMAESVRTTDRRYAETDESAARRLERESR